MTIDKGDVLGVLFLLPVAYCGVGFLAGCVFSVLVGERLKWSEALVVAGVCGALSGVGWLVWEFAHWFTRGG